MTSRGLEVLHVGKYYPPVPGGMERVLKLLCDRERHHVDPRVLVMGTGPHTTHDVVDGVPVTRVGTKLRVGSVALGAVPVELARASADVTVIHEPNPVALVADAVTLRRGPLVVYFHSEVVRARWKYLAFYRPFLARVLARASKILVASPAMRDTAAQLEGYRHKCEVVPYGIELADLVRTPAIGARAEAVRTASSDPVLLFVGRLVPYKGVDVLIKAMSAVRARLIVVGEGPERGPLESLASQSGVGDRVHFAGAVDDDEVLALYHACEVFVLPSVTRAEAFGMVQLEAMACGKPVVSTSLPSGVPWVNQHGVSGLVVPPGDAHALAEALSHLLHDDRARQTLGAGARRRVEDEFTADRMAARTVEIYKLVA